MTDGQVVRLATRGSPLALWQARRVAALLHRVGVASDLVVLETVGDRRADVPLEELGGQGVFVKEIQAAVADGRADAAVHSAKDLPASPELAVPGLVVAAVPERADRRDVLVGATLDALPSGATVATGSARRRVQLANLRPDLTFVGLRGNLATRLAVAGTGGVTAVVAAKAALDRLEWTPPTGTVCEVLDPEVMLPQVGQGALALECRDDDPATVAALTAIDDVLVTPLVQAERAFLAELGGGCTLPVGASAEWVVPGVTLTLSGLMASGDGRTVLRAQLQGDRPADLGAAVARYLIDDAGGRALDGWMPPDTGPAVGVIGDRP